MLNRRGERENVEQLAEQRRQALLREVASGRKVTLVPAQGPPTWYRWAVRDVLDTASDSANKPFSIHADGFALVELLPAHSLSSYRLRAQIHHDGGARDGRVGIYFGHSKRVTVQGRDADCFAAASFNDISVIAGQPPERGNQMRLNLHVLLAPFAGKSAANRQHGTGVATLLKPVGTVQPEKYRNLEICVTPEQIQVVWDQIPLTPLPREKLSTHVQRFLANNPMKPGENPEFLPREALGIFIHSATAWVRSVTIEALPNDPHNQGD
jgi:hypothetical protein